MAGSDIMYFDQDSYDNADPCDYYPDAPECEQCQDVEITLRECKKSVSVLFKQLYSEDELNSDVIDACMNNLVSYLDAIDQWPKDKNGQYISLNVKRK